MLVSLSPPDELQFRRPFTKTVVTQSLTVKNDDPSQPVAFKVKTTAPKQYCVRPNSGMSRSLVRRIAPGKSCQVQVLLQTMKEDPPADFKCKDRFLVQSIRIPHDLASITSDTDAAPRLAELWAQAEALKKTDPTGASEILTEQKLKCVFLPADAEGDRKSVTSPGRSSPSIKRPSSPISATNTPYSPKLPESAAADNAANLQQLQETVKRLSLACEGYKQEIDRLNGLKQRTGSKVDSMVASPGVKTVSVDKNASSGKLKMGSGGMSVQVAAVIALIAFLLGVLLF
ncbi:MAG: hypothetical protein SGCHY_004902 [Lobulomycetales sp.]